MLLLFQPAQSTGDEVLATRVIRHYFCENGHVMLILLTARRLKCINPSCEFHNILYVLPTEQVELVAA